MIRGRNRVGQRAVIRQGDVETIDACLFQPADDRIQILFQHACFAIIRIDLPDMPNRY